MESGHKTIVSVGTAETGGLGLFLGNMLKGQKETIGGRDRRWRGKVSRQREERKKHRRTTCKTGFQRATAYPRPELLCVRRQGNGGPRKKARRTSREEKGRRNRQLHKRG